MVEDKFGYELVDELLTENDLPSGGVYTAIGTYENREMAMLLNGLHHKTQIPISTLLHTFGEHLFITFSQSYPSFFQGITDAFDFLESIETHIHIEVKKLYPDAELPHLITRRLNTNQLEMIYHSERRMSELALGLIESSLKYFGEKATVDKEILEADGAKVRFLISRE